MRIERVHRWQWVIIGLLVGFLIGYVRNLFSGEDVSGYGNSMNGQEQFESAMLSHERLPNGETRPLFYKLVVFNIKDPNATLRSPEEIQKSLTPEQKKKFDLIKKNSDQMAFLREIAQAEADNRRTYAVAGVYYNRRPSQNTKTGAWEKVWHDYFYITPNPYKPTRQFAVTGNVPQLKPTMLDRLQRLAEKTRLKQPDPPDSVLSYLRALKATGRIDFTYEWWKTPRVSIALWMAGCLVLIGGVWPTVVNLLVHGTFTRPYEEKVDLSKVSSKTVDKRPRGPSQADLDELKALEEELEAKLKASGPGGVPAPSDKPAPAPVKPLTAKELEVAAAAKAEEDRLFAAKADDYYPTEKRTKHKDE